MLSSIIEFAMLHRAAARTTAVQQAAQSERTAQAPVTSSTAPAEEATEFEMSILDQEPVFGDAMWEHAGHVTTDCF